MSPSPRNCTPSINLGLASNEVRLAPYSPLWPEYYQNELARLNDLLVKSNVMAEHIGSTAIPDMPAKPIIDIMLGATAGTSLESLTQGLAELGYLCHGEKGVPGRLFFTCGEPCTHHIHLVKHRGSFWVDHLLFRDELKRNAQAASEYRQVKLNLAQKFANNRQQYTDSKAPTITSILERVQSQHQKRHLPEDSSNG